MKVNIPTLILVILLSLTTIGFCCLWLNEVQKTHEFTKLDRKQIMMLDAFDTGKTCINDSAFVDYAHLIGLPQIEISLMLAHIESGRWTSPIFKETNNMFGIKYFPNARHNTTDSNAMGYIKYRHWTESLIGLKRYYQLAGTHLVGYSATEGYWSRNWGRWIAYCHSRDCKLKLDSKHKIIF